MRLNFPIDPRIWRVLLVCYWLTLIVLTHIPSSSIRPPFTLADKVAHLIAFAILAALLATTWQFNAGRLTAQQLTWAWLILVVFAALDEWTQGFVGRQPDIVDWIADAFGAMMGLIVFAWIRRSSRVRRPIGIADSDGRNQ